jgi:Fic family protein
MRQDIWKQVDDLNREYNSLNLNNSVLDYEKYKLYSIVTSSTRLEGSTLTEVDTQLLLDDGLTARGKPLEHHLMVKDNFNAMQFVMLSGDNKESLSPVFLKKLNSLNMAFTGQLVNSALGVVDGKTSDFRLVNAFSEALGYYLEPLKIPKAVDNYCTTCNERLASSRLDVDRLKVSFDAHAMLVLVHPWQDGNKRTSRLVMNFIQRRENLPLTKVHKEDGMAYIAALKTAKESGDYEAFREFMAGQHVKTLKNEINRYRQMNTQNKGLNFLL